jgi:hypothetical protein
MPLKTYETIGILNRSITAIIDGREVSIYFANGTSSPRLIQGRFTTDNKKIQEYIETSGNFNKKYRLVSTVLSAEDKKVVSHDEPEDDKAKVPVKPPQSQEDDTATIGSVPEDTDEDIVEETIDASPKRIMPAIVGDEVVNGQQARNYLMEHVKDLTFRQVTNNQQIIAVAKENNIQFAHWDAFVTSK